MTFCRLTRSNQRNQFEPTCDFTQPNICFYCCFLFLPAKQRKGVNDPEGVQSEYDSYFVLLHFCLELLMMEAAFLSVQGGFPVFRSSRSVPFGESADAPTASESIFAITVGRPRRLARHSAPVLTYSCCNFQRSYIHIINAYSVNLHIHRINKSFSC